MSKINRLVFPWLPSEPRFNYKLIRKDGLERVSADVKWVVWNKDGTLKSLKNKPKVGRSLILSPFSRSYTWLTTPVVEILDKGKGFVVFKTKNSNYKLNKL